MDFQADDASERSHVHKFAVVSPQKDVPPCALECKPKEVLDPKFCTYQFFAMVDDKYSTVAFGRSPNTFHVAFKPDDWEAIESVYTVGKVLSLEMWPIGQEMHADAQTLNQMGTSAPLIDEDIDIENLLKGLIDEVVDELTVPVQDKLDNNKKMIDDIINTQNQRQENLAEIIREEIRLQKQIQGVENEEGEPCKCIIS